MSAVREKLRSNITRSIKSKETMLEDTRLLSEFEKAVTRIIDSYRAGGRLYIAGNGGSAADAQHLAAEFVSKLAKDRNPLPAEALTVDSSILTAIGNDYGYENVFSRQIEAKLKTCDIFLAITTSGESENILRALEQCRKQKIPSILLTGRQGGRAAVLSDYVLTAPGNDTSLIQEQHVVLYHTICGCVEEALFP